MKNFKTFEKETLTKNAMKVVKGGADYKLFQEVDATGKMVYYTVALDASGKEYKLFQEIDASGKIMLGNATLDNNWA
jgi:hypothetical protein